MDTITQDPTPNKKSRRRSPGVTSAAVAALGYTKQSLFKLIHRSGGEAVALRLRNFARGKPENVASELEKLAVAFEQGGDAR